MPSLLRSLQYHCNSSCHRGWMCRYLDLLAPRHNFTSHEEVTPCCPKTTILAARLHEPDRMTMVSTSKAAIVEFYDHIGKAMGWRQGHSFASTHLITSLHRRNGGREMGTGVRWGGLTTDLRHHNIDAQGGANARSSTYGSAHSIRCR